MAYFSCKSFGGRKYDEVKGLRDDSDRWCELVEELEQISCVTTINHSPDSYVSELIDPDTRMWKNQLVKSIFQGTKADDILKIPLGSGNEVDKWV
ncbi:hypothetical protein ACH5RR_034259 [Cinchona calisaya]|uniref:Uncharacterized protein n=1 Tax=Cinchona calisaya TaxID=153742 RepID=A0ABD2YAC4_9GENT